MDVYRVDGTATAGSIIYGVNKAQLLATTPAVPAPTGLVIIDGNEVRTLQPVMTQASTMSVFVPKIPVVTRRGSTGVCIYRVYC